MADKLMYCLRALPLTVVAACVFHAGPVKAVTIMPAGMLPNAVSLEYFGLNFAENERLSTSVGTLDYSGQPGCGGLCVATTALGADPSASITVNEVTYQLTAGGSAQAALGYYVDYLNAPGTYSVNLQAPDSFDITDGVYAFTDLRIGPAGASIANFNNFTSTTFEETQCFNGCPSSTPAGATMQPFPADTLIQMQANTLYFVQLDALIAAGATGKEDTATIDPIFSTNSGGSFLFSPGVFSPSSAVPEPASWCLFIGGFGVVGGALRRRPARAGLA